MYEKTTCTIIYKYIKTLQLFSSLFTNIKTQIKLLINLLKMPSSGSLDWIRLNVICRNEITSHRCNKVSFAIIKCCTIHAQ